MFIPHTEVEKDAMLKSIGVKDIKDLFTDVPEKYRFPKLNLPPGVTELEVMTELSEYAAANELVGDMACFLGAGAYHHYIPAVVDSLLRRGEFYTAYTPYQPEISQGTLQAVFEFQTLIANLTGMEVCNASHYDGATATAEAGVMAYHHFRGKRKKILLSPAIHPHYREVLCSYLCGFEDIEISSGTLQADLSDQPDDLIKQVDDQTALVVVQYPDFFGRIQDFSNLVSSAHQTGALIAFVTNPTALGVLKTPGELGADIVVGEGQPLGIPLSYGGPYLGYFATRKEYVRKLAGRLVGETSDALGRRGYVLTLTAREQHIRREKATSNICSNQGLMALAATIYMSLVGKHGMRQVAELCYQKAHYAASEIAKLSGFKVITREPFFHEFVVKCPTAVNDINHELLDMGFIGGYDLGSSYSEMQDNMLVAVTEMNTKEDIDAFVAALQEVTND
ncbi:MAG TPA: aminomethyl-transferring glycine dehydrogenase subunit GcvPA [Anaerolineaceae bacterium]|nr:aminomethyl-transferring glycine dehydrogenase subunit GcvPA [Anaerolineaceae bacterium]